MALDPAELKPGEEIFEDLPPGPSGRERVLYQYRHTDGQVFAWVAPDLAKARARRDVWLELRGKASPLVARVLNQRAHVVL